MESSEMSVKLFRRNVIFVTLVLIGTIGLFPDRVAGPIAHAKSTQYFNAPASFNQLAEMVSPAVVNIRTVKTIKGGGPVFRQFQRGPHGEKGPFKDFFHRGDRVEIGGKPAPRL